MFARLWSKLSRKAPGGSSTVLQKLPTAIPERERESDSTAAGDSIDVTVAAPGPKRMPVLADVQRQPASGVTFPVDAVTPADKPIWTDRLADSLAWRLRRKIVSLPDAELQVINPVFDALRPETKAKLDSKRMGGRRHALIDAVHVAFSQHRPLALSPDTIWLVVVQGFSDHVAENAETLRGRLVRHDGRRTLQTKCEDLELASFQHAIADFSSQIRDATDPVLHETLVCDFSTTTPGIRTASEVAIMNCFSSYFAYEMMCVCGIPKITIEGTPEDWGRIRARIEVLATYGLEWWLARVRPILDQFILAAEGCPNPEFWQAIYKPVNAYGDRVATGWITDLFPYLGDAPERRRNHVFEHERRDWALGVEEGVETSNFAFSPLAGKGVRLASFPSGLSSVPVNVQLPNASNINLDLVAGFLGVRQHRSDLTLSPVIGWSVAEPPPTRPVLI
jgi:hypothetical protein